MNRKCALIPIACLVSLPYVAQAELPNPARYLATLSFDGKDYFDSGEKNFPHAFRFTSYDGNVEHNKENEVNFKIGDTITGTGSTGQPNRGPNDQRPAVYFHVSRAGKYEVYQYWLYYADNDWINNHEHDWEMYFVYLKDGKPSHLLVGSHYGNTFHKWEDIAKDDSHPIMGVDGGSHAMKLANEDGVKIRYDGQITKNNGRLDAGHGTTHSWMIYSNDPAIGVTHYAQTPNTFYYGDPAWQSGNSEYSDPRPAPWIRPEWSNPPQP
ncbi:hypothetical protein [Chitinivorax sp. B]|uniref:hypothetical protein n=1 Tax=Chitinivorax sp. B TaxID=2502235 RepID=UPI0010F7B00B|nr:hypothetical protein [Chitinivorax sp. B]